LECGGSTPLSFFRLSAREKKESGVEPPHSKRPLVLQDPFFCQKPFADPLSPDCAQEQETAGDPFVVRVLARWPGVWRFQSEGISEAASGLHVW